MKQTIITITGEGDSVEMEVKSTDYEAGKTATFSLMLGKEAKAKTRPELYKVQYKVVNGIIELLKQVAPTLPDKNVIITGTPKQ